MGDLKLDPQRTAIVVIDLQKGILRMPGAPVGSRNSKRLERRGLHSELSLAVDRGWQGENHAPTSQESEFERLCGTLGAIGETRMPVEADLVRGEAAAPSPAAIRGPLPRGAQSPGQAERMCCNFRAAGW